jgi:ADP-ribose pyrophosphatase YjhB (NUDIX family)
VVVKNNYRRRMNKPKKINIIVSVGVWNDQGKFLMVEEGKEHVKGLWSLPSGRLEFNETLIEGAIRETLEETGCKVKIVGICGIYHYQLEDSKGMSIRVCFHGELISQNLSAELEEDVLSCAWKTRKEVEEMIDAGKLRGKFVEKIIREYFVDKRYSLDVLTEL